MYFVYILLCADGTYYCGATNNLQKRLKQHSSEKNGAHYTKIRRPVTLKYSQQFQTLKEARAREAEIKKLTKDQKELLFP